MRPLREHLEQRLMRLSLIDLALLVASVAAAFVVADRIAGVRLGRLVEQVQRIGAGDLGSGVDPSGRDEIAVLGRHINAMAEQLAASRAELESAHAERVEALAGLRHSDRLASVGRLASAMAHELGTPLNVVLARAKLVAAGDAAGDEVRRNAEIIAQQVQRMTQTLGGVLGFARSAAARARVDLRDVARDTLRLLEPLARRRGVSLELSAPETAVWVNARRQELEQVVINLLNNALDAVARGGGVSVVVDRALEPDERGGGPGRPRAGARVAVRDDGAGIAPERLARLFEPFYTTKQEGRGTGLGLWIADGIVREHGGEIEVESRVAAGSCFRVKLPAEGTA
jgi:signal transduction histidine kinase